VDRLNLPFGPMQVRVGGAGGGGEPLTARLAQGISFRVGALEIAGSVAIVMPSKPEMSLIHDGIVGASLFRNTVVSIDRELGVVRFTRPGHWTPPADAAVVPLDLSGGHACVEAGLVQSSGQVMPVRLILDLGATHAVSLNTHSGSGIAVPDRAVAARVGRGMSGVLTGRVGRIAGLDIGGHRLAGVVATFPDSAFENPRGLDSRDGNLGSGVLSRFELTLDYASAKMYLRPNRRFSDPFEWDMTGVTFDPSPGGKLVVAEVLPGSPGGRAGIAPGDELVAVDGEPADPRAMMRDRSRFRQAGRVLVLRLRTAGKERDVRLKLVRLV
jgi:hypothetical protein